MCLFTGRSINRYGWEYGETHEVLLEKSNSSEFLKPFKAWMEALKTSPRFRGQSVTRCLAEPPRWAYLLFFLSGLLGGPSFEAGSPEP